MSEISRARHVLVARLDNVGDVLLTGPAVRAIATRAERVTFVASPGGAPAAARLPGVDAVIQFNAPWSGFPPPPVDGVALDQLVARVRDAQIDEAFIFTSSHQSPLPMALLLRLAGVPWIGATSRDFAGSLLDLRRRPPGDRHEVERALGLVEAAGYELPKNDPRALTLRGRLPVWRPFGRPYVVVHPGASVAARACDASFAAEVAALLAGDGWAVAVTGSPAERDLTAQVAAAHADVRDLGGETDFDHLAAVIEGADAVVCGNTGPAHIAAAVATPVVSIFAPVVPAERWRPWAVPHALLGQQDIECRGCRARVCPRPQQLCVAGISPRAVVDAVRSLTSPGGAAGTAPGRAGKHERLAQRTEVRQ